MNEKEKLIMEESMKLFAKKGFAATSIQEIATVCGISKGAFYLHFKSKEALLLAILHYYFRLMFNRLADIEKEALPPREKFVKQLECQMRDIHQHKEFIIMQARENAIPFNEEIEAFIFKMRTETHQFYRKRLFAIYGEEIEPYFWDFSLALQGIQQSFLHVSMLDGLHLDYRQLAAFFLDCADDLAAGFRRRSGKPVADPAVMAARFQPSVDDDFILAWLADLQTKPFDEDIAVSLDVIKQELSGGQPRAAVLRGMLANLSSEPRLQEFMQTLKEYYHIL